MQKFQGVYIIGEFGAEVSWGIYIYRSVGETYIAYTCMYNMVAVTMYIYIHL